MPSSTLNHVSNVRRLTEKQLVDEARRTLRISQKELAAHLGMSEDQLYRRKTGEVTMPSRMKSQLRMIVSSGRMLPSGVGAGSVTIMPRDPVVAAAEASRWTPSVRAEELQLSIDLDAPDPALAELENAFLGVPAEAPATAASGSLQEMHDGIAKDYPRALAASSGRVSVELLCGRLETFGLKMTRDMSSMSRAERHQAETIFLEYYRSHDVLLEWCGLLSKDEGGAVAEALAAIESEVETLAIAKMDLNSIYASQVERPRFDGRAAEVKAELRPRIKAYLNALVQSDATIRRDPYRLVDAGNDALAHEIRSLHGAGRYEVVDHFTMAERAILREIASLRREVNELIELRKQVRQ
jgi:DNA-binding transcriptional regulator YiaG